ncbi:MAG: LexA family transcriptional repressor [Candidatus Synechococcus spongiarum SP3]|uniref:LexA repressor n=1 Tax=Candidatus Synechococcus spongiarum SP3 TaxID=1604020 RepID=A0A0G2HJY5_9SYNE|nr:MAG: LexA family transcriptional repressor [Candidatus Synechococcus spongiarum SP3]
MKPQPLTVAQQELYDWIVEFLANHGHAPSIRQMMEAMGLRSPAPIQSRLRYLQKKGWIQWKPGRARTLQLNNHPPTGIPVLGTVSAGGLVKTFPDVEDHLDLQTTLKEENVFALTVCGDSMIGAHITAGDMAVMKPVTDIQTLPNGAIVSAMVPGEGTTLKFFHKNGPTIRLEPANLAYKPIILPAEQVVIQGRLVAVWRQVQAFAGRR